MKECPACRRCFPDDINHCPQDGDATTQSLLGEPILDARYQLERRLGAGGMGVVFQARHIFLKTSHAIKVILPDLVGNDPMLVTRFRQEALAAAAIRHPNIIAVTDFGVVRGTMPFLVMEFVSGKSLQEMLAEEGAMSPHRALELMNAIGAGVSAAHRQNIVHRDLKPLNIMTQDKVPVAEGLKILDFGLAKIKSGELLGSFVQAKTTGLMGSPFYMAPEQWSDEEPDSRADVYSLGIILYQMLAGDVPFKGSSIPSIMKKHLTMPPPSFQSIGVDVDPAIEAVVRHALEKDVAARTPSVGEFLIELRNAVNSTPKPASVPRDTGGADANRTLVSQPLAGSTVPPVVGQETNVGTPYESLAGTVNTNALGEVKQEQVSTSAEAYKAEHEARERAAREELAREAEARREAEDTAARKRKAEEDRVRKEREEKEERERQQREQLERVARQASELEERLARLSTSMTPGADPEATQVHHSGASLGRGGISLAGERTGRLQVDIPAKTRNPAIYIGAALIALLLVGGAIAAYVVTRPKTIVDDPGHPTPSPTVPGQTFKADLVEIPGGTFKMGRNDGPIQERPAHTVTVETFFLDRNEVINEEYAEFVRETNAAAPSNWNKGKPVFGQEKWPVANVSAEDAKNFAAWRSSRDGVTYRLPTEEEWEYAARGGDQDSLYPWGNEWENDRAVVKVAFPQTVGSLKDGQNRWGVNDLIGNVWEWTSTTFAFYPGNKGREVPPEYQTWIIKRGGSFASDPHDKANPITSAYRDFAPGSTRDLTIGFRLARSAVETVRQ
jgi:serine/threonine protein kinase/formylglycine-generating enzyme required for sulfatase activity